MPEDLHLHPPLDAFSRAVPSLEKQEVILFHYNEDEIDETQWIRRKKLLAWPAGESHTRASQECGFRDE